MVTSDFADCTPKDVEARYQQRSAIGPAFRTMRKHVPGRVLDTITPSNLLQQVRYSRFQHERAYWEHIGER